MQSTAAQTPVLKDSYRFQQDRRMCHTFGLEATFTIRVGDSRERHYASNHFRNKTHLPSIFVFCRSQSYAARRQLCLCPSLRAQFPRMLYRYTRADSNWHRAAPLHFPRTHYLRIARQGDLHAFGIWNGHFWHGCCLRKDNAEPAFGPPMLAARSCQQSNLAERRQLTTSFKHWAR